jgi:hypothetical protein
MYLIYSKHRPLLRYLRKEYYLYYLAIRKERPLYYADYNRLIGILTERGYVRGVHYRAVIC